MSVIVYSKSDCAQCVLTKQTLDILGIDYESIDLTRRPDQLARLIGLGHRRLPVVEAGQESWSGHDPKKISRLLSYD